MIPKRALAVVVVLLLAPLSFPASAEDECEAGVAQLESAVAESPGEMTSEVASALADALAACGTTSSTAAGGGGAQAKAKVSPARLACRAGSLSGVGPMQVVIAAPPLGRTPVFQEAALETYTLYASGAEMFSARGGSSVGFDAYASPAGGSYGVVYIAGQAFQATDWGVSGACNSHRMTPCAGSGYAVLAGIVEVWLSGYLLVC